jgi:hypothetical protein
LESREHVRDQLLPVRLWLKLVRVVAPEGGEELGAWDKLGQVGVKANLVACDRVKERADTLVEEVEEGWKEDDDTAAECLDVVVLKDDEDLGKGVLSVCKV